MEQEHVIVQFFASNLFLPFSVIFILINYVLQYLPKKNNQDLSVFNILSAIWYLYQTLFCLCLLCLIFWLTSTGLTWGRCHTQYWFFLSWGWLNSPEVIVETMRFEYSNQNTYFFETIKKRPEIAPAALVSRVPPGAGKSLQKNRWKGVWEIVNT